jgi:hypothetical protein
MWDIQIAKCSRCVRSVRDNKAPETWPFPMEFVPEGEPVVVSGGVRDEVCTLYRWGRGYAACSRKYSCWFGLRTGQSDCCVGRVNNKATLCMYYLWIRVYINHCQYTGHCVLVQCDQLSNYPAHTCTSLRLRHVSIKVLCEVPATPDGQIPHKMGDVNPNTPISITL